MPSYRFCAIAALVPRTCGRHATRLAVAVALGFLAPAAPAATSVFQYGFTWKWSEDRQVGQYCNGDWWVVGPVTITSITPASTRDANGWTRNGTMVNPAKGYGQGYDSSITHYGAFYTGNVAPSATGSPLLVSTGSVVSTVSKSIAGSAATRPQLLVGAVLTVVSQAPPAGAFRPPVMGTDKSSRWTESQLDYSILKSLSPVSSTPPLATVEGYLQRPWFCQMDNSPSRYISPQDNMPEYGRDQAHQLGDAMLSLHLNYSNAQKRNLYIRLVQYGIDIHGSVKAGTMFMDNGGLNVGRKAPLVLAACALKDPELLKWADGGQNFVFHEDRQTFIVQQSDVGRQMYTADGRVRETYRQEHVGMPEWGEKHSSNPSRDGSNWDILYRHSNGGPVMGNFLAILLTTGGRAVWNWEPFFLYQDRFWNIEKNGQYSGLPNAMNSFVIQMMSQYRDLGAGPGGKQPPPTSKPATPTGFGEDK